MLVHKVVLEQSETSNFSFSGPSLSILGNSFEKRTEDLSLHDTRQRRGY